MNNEGIINQQYSKYNIMVEQLNEQIIGFQLTSLEILENKSKGLDVVNIDVYEELINWSIENLTIIRDILE